jgi:hypothetical protein
MNAKKAKELRAFVRSLPMKPLIYNAYSPPLFKLFELHDQTTGAVVGHKWLKVARGVPRQLIKSCQRGVYQKTKRGRV